MSSTESTIYLDRLAAIFRNFDWDENKQKSPHPCKEILTQIWPVFERCLGEQMSDNKSVERWCRYEAFYDIFLKVTNSTLLGGIWY